MKLEAPMRCSLPKLLPVLLVLALQVRANTEIVNFAADARPDFPSLFLHAQMRAWPVLAPTPVGAPSEWDLSRAVLGSALASLCNDAHLDEDAAGNINGGCAGEFWAVLVLKPGARYTLRLSWPASVRLLFRASLGCLFFVAWLLTSCRYPCLPIAYC